MHKLVAQEYSTLLYFGDDKYYVRIIGLKTSRWL